jgi:hypothetical protein
VVLGSGGTIVPGDGTAGSTLSAASLTWFAGGRLAFDLTSGNRLAVAGALLKGDPWAVEVALGSSTPLPVGSVHTLATFSATDFTASDFSFSGLPGHRGLFVVGPAELQFLVTGFGPAAEYTHWSYTSGLPEGAREATDDPDLDGIVNLLEFLTASDPLRANPQALAVTTVEEDGRVYPAVRFTRRVNLGGVTAGVLASAMLDFSSSLGTVEVSASGQGDGTEEVVVRSRVPLTAKHRQFFRLTATLPLAGAETSVVSSPVGMLAAPLLTGHTGIAMPLTARDLFVGVVEAHGPADLAFAPAHGHLAELLDPDRAYYVEVQTGALAGERLDVDTAATLEASGSTLVLSLGAGSASTLASLPAGAFTGSRVALRPHVTLRDLGAMVDPPLHGHQSPGRADGVWLFENGDFRFYHLGGDQATWMRAGSSVDFASKVIPPDVSVFLKARGWGKWFVHGGAVREHSFRKNLAAGLQAFATGFPVDLTPAQARAFVDTDTPPENGWTGSRAPAKADEIRVMVDPSLALRLYLGEDGTTWRAFGIGPDLSGVRVLRALGMVVVERKNPDPAYRIPAPASDDADAGGAATPQ